MKTAEAMNSAVIALALWLGLFVPVELKGSNQSSPGNGLNLRSSAGVQFRRIVLFDNQLSG